MKKRDAHSHNNNKSVEIRWSINAQKLEIAWEFSEFFLVCVCCRSCSVFSCSLSPIPSIYLCVMYSIFMHIHVKMAQRRAQHRQMSAHRTYKLPHVSGKRKVPSESFSKTANPSDLFCCCSFVCCVAIVCDGGHGERNTKNKNCVLQCHHSSNKSFNHLEKIISLCHIKYTSVYLPTYVRCGVLSGVSRTRMALNFHAWAMSLCCVHCAETLQSCCERAQNMITATRF